MTTMDKKLEKSIVTIKDAIKFDDFDIDSIDIYIIKSAVDKIPTDGVYDTNVVENRIGQFIAAMGKCSDLLALLDNYSSFCEDQVRKEEANAVLDRATQLGYKTAGERKIYAQKDELYLAEKAKLNRVKATIIYVEGLRTSLHNAHLHCKKILNRGIEDEKFANDTERFSPTMPKKIEWDK